MTSPTTTEVGRGRPDLEELAARVESGTKTIDNPKVSEWQIFANARRICKREYQRSPNWVLAMNAFGLGSTWAWALCERIGVDPEGRTMAPHQSAAALRAMKEEGR